MRHPSNTPFLPIFAAPLREMQNFSDKCKISAHRTHLVAMIQEAISTKDTKLAGILLHAFGDSFAHTERNGADFRAFSSSVGHALSNGPLTGTKKGGHAVDQIMERYADEVYPDYVRALSKALGVPAENMDLVDKLIERMRPHVVEGKVNRKLVAGERHYGDSNYYQLTRYDEADEYKMLASFPVSKGEVNGNPDTYENNAKSRAKNYFPEKGETMTGYGDIPFDDMRLIVGKMKDRFGKDSGCK